LGIGYLKTDRA